jgi:hypothetical protein
MESVSSNHATVARFSERREDAPAPPASGNTISEDVLDAMEARQAVLELQIDRLVRTAPTLPDAQQQQQCWDYARDVQRELRAVREQLRLARQLSQSKPSS